MGVEETKSLSITRAKVDGYARRRFRKRARQTPPGIKKNWGRMKNFITRRGKRGAKGFQSRTSPVRRKNVVGLKKKRRSLVFVSPDAGRA